MEQGNIPLCRTNPQLLSKGPERFLMGVSCIEHTLRCGHMAVLRAREIQELLVMQMLLCQPWGDFSMSGAHRS